MGKLKWSPYEYYTSSPYEFYYACKGYFDEKDKELQLFRNVAMFASGMGVHEKFNNAWPNEYGEERQVVSISEQEKQDILKIHNVKI